MPARYDPGFLTATGVAESLPMDNAEEFFYEYRRRFNELVMETFHRAS
jgi:hypothetical protein